MLIIEHQGSRAMSAETTSDYARQDVFDPVSNPELFSGVRSRRIFAFCIDLIVITLFTFAAGIVVFFLGWKCASGMAPSPTRFWQPSMSSCSGSRSLC
jgi:hypothetical protein